MLNYGICNDKFAFLFSTTSQLNRLYFFLYYPFISGIIRPLKMYFSGKKKIVFSYRDQEPFNQKIPVVPLLEFLFELRKLYFSLNLM